MRDQSLALHIKTLKLFQYIPDLVLLLWLRVVLHGPFPLILILLFVAVVPPSHVLRVEDVVEKVIELAFGSGLIPILVVPDLGDSRKSESVSCGVAVGCNDLSGLNFQHHGIVEMVDPAIRPVLQRMLPRVLQIAGLVTAFIAAEVGLQSAAETAKLFHGVAGADLGEGQCVSNFGIQLIDSSDHPDKKRSYLVSPVPPLAMARGGVSVVASHYYQIERVCESLYIVTLELEPAAASFLRHVY